MRRYFLILPCALLVAACSDREVGYSDAFTPIGGTSTASVGGTTSYPISDYEPGIGELPPDARVTQTGDFNATVTAAIDEASGSGVPINPETGLPATAGVAPNAQSINLAASSQAVQAAQREVAARELEEARQQLVIVQPDALPQRRNEQNVAAFALATSHGVGERKYSRGFGGSASASNAACGRYRTGDEAQSAFLSRGGPERDPGNLDPDGDGFACGWSPEPYRRMLNGG
ncbi:hypothetical protein [Oceanomicrobium pacificus]|uniref:Excalibur calcium-binding domain-containing protein n=1 Tax=Oceanomicrobium pacificus TaxID=2692916 RepID=A0A6B0TLL3_9RHOB|nr:hypothetical protein [Oceanomicrobium pacificus]MXU65407.1 hypothetical protein [Oceanomicrobium pacificus]